MMALLAREKSFSSGMPGGYAVGSVCILIQICNWREFIFFKALELKFPGEGHQPKEELCVKLGEGNSNNAKYLESVHLPKGLWFLLAVIKELKHP